MAAPLKRIVGPFEGIRRRIGSKLGLARPVATQNVPPPAMKCSMAARFSGEISGVGAPA